MSSGQKIAPLIKRGIREAMRDPDDLHGDQTVFLIEIRVRRNGAMSVAGDFPSSPAYALACLDHARQTIKDYQARSHLGAGKELIVPPGATDLAKGGA